MRASKSLLLVAQAVTIAASPIHDIRGRQADAIKSALSTVGASLQDLDTAIKGVTTDPTSAIPLLGASEKAQASLTQAATQIQSADDVGLIGALGLQGSAGDLVTQVETTMADLVAKKPVFDQLGVSSVVLDSLQKQKTASTGLSDALLSKVPALARPIAQQSSDKISAALDMGISAMSEPPANGTPTTPAPTLAPSEPPAATASAAPSEPPEATASVAPSEPPQATASAAPSEPPQATASAAPEEEE